MTTILTIKQSKLCMWFPTANIAHCTYNDINITIAQVLFRIFFVVSIITMY